MDEEIEFFLPLSPIPLLHVSQLPSFPPYILYKNCSLLVPRYTVSLPPFFFSFLRNTFPALLSYIIFSNS